MTGSSQHRFMKGKSCLTNLTALYRKITGLLDERRAVCIVYINFSKAFDTVSCSNLIDKLLKCGLDKWAVRRGNWLKCQAQSVAISSIKAN